MTWPKITIGWPLVGGLTVHCNLTLNLGSVIAQAYKRSRSVQRSGIPFQKKLISRLLLLYFSCNNMVCTSSCPRATVASGTCTALTVAVLKHFPPRVVVEATGTLGPVYLYLGQSFLAAAGSRLNFFMDHIGNSLGASRCEILAQFASCFSHLDVTTMPAITIGVIALEFIICSRLAALDVVNFVVSIDCALA